MTQGNIVDWFYRWVRGFVTGYFVCNLAEPQLRGQAPNSHHTWQNFQALLKIVARVVLIWITSTTELNWVLESGGAD